MKIALVTDSTADLPQDVVQKFDIGVVPLYINVGDKGYLDGVEMSREEFYTRLPNFKPHPTTAVPGIDAFVDVFKKAIDKGAEAIISLHIGNALSNTVDVARLAAKKIKKFPCTSSTPATFHLAPVCWSEKQLLWLKQGKRLKIFWR